MIVDVVLAATPVTSPDPSTDALALLASHVPPVLASLSVVTAPTHTFSTPLRVAGCIFTVTVDVVRHPVAVIL